MSDENFNLFTMYTDEIVCPWCGYERSDSWEVESGDRDCTECDKRFRVTINNSYTTDRIKEDGRLC